MFNDTTTTLHSVQLHVYYCDLFLQMMIDDGIVRLD